MLRLHLLDGLIIDRIGAMYHVHRATVARWIAHARETLATEFYRQLSDRLHAWGTELDSLMRFVRSQVAFSLSDALGRKANSAS